MKKPKFQQIDIQNLEIKGWLLDQLKIQANGLCGNLDKVWKDVKDSGWLGGDGDSWERLPCWLDGFMPLAYLLKDQDMIERVKKYIDVVIERQCDDGWLSPSEDRRHYDLWAEILMIKVLAEYSTFSGDERGIVSAHKALLCLYDHIELKTIHGWASARWFEALTPILIVYEKTGDNRLIALANTLYATGFDYEKMYETFSFDSPRERKYWNFSLHNVNLAMGLKSKALYGLFKEGEEDFDGGFAKAFLEKILSKHGLGMGHFSGDECLSGSSPIHGAELCGIAEAMFSAEILLRITGDAYWGDYLETLAFNALPAAFTTDMWAHQYDQQVNQIECSKQDDDIVPFNSNNGEAHLFGLEPHYGCCTANHGHAFPKFAMSAISLTSDGIGILSPVPVKAKVELNGVKGEVEIKSSYPFKDRFEIEIKWEKPTYSKVYVRIPAFVDGAKVNGKEVETGKFFVLEKEFSSESVSVEFKCLPKLKKTNFGMNILRRGPLFYSVPIKYEKVTREYVRETSSWASYNICTVNKIERKFPYCDYELFPKTPWNYAFVEGEEFEYLEGEVSKTPFEQELPPCKIKTKMARIPWRKENGMATERPDSLEVLGYEEVQLIPYGSTMLRMSEMPEVK